MRVARLALASLFACTLGCNKPEVTAAGNTGGDNGGGGNGDDTGGSGGGRSGNGGGNGGSGGSHAPDAGFGFEVHDAGTKPPPTMPMECASSTAKAMAIPLDVFLLVDTSGSMADPSGAGQSKWQMVRSALISFLGDPGSSGLGAGLQFFPRLRSCTTNTECSSSGSLGATCFTARKCVTAGQPVTDADDCETQDDCLGGGTCTAIGICPASGDFCAPVGQACGGAMASDTCKAISSFCDAPFSIDPVVCQGPTYAKPAVEIAALPPNAGKITDALKAAYPQGGTPMKAALTGAYTYVQQYAAAHPDRKVVVVLATDGLPMGCQMGNDPQTPAAAALAATPSISTYAIGVFAQGEMVQGEQVLTRVATAGGTMTPFVLQPGANLAQTFLATLNQIRGAALPCSFGIPAMPSGAIDYGKVNVQYQSSGGSKEELLYVGSANACDATKGGWYYDADPKAGGTPKQVILCPASCQKVKADANAQVALQFGCATHVIQ